MRAEAAETAAGGGEGEEGDKEAQEGDDDEGGESDDGDEEAEADSADGFSGTGARRADPDCAAWGDNEDQLPRCQQEWHFALLHLLLHRLLAWRQVRVCVREQRRVW